MTQATLPPELIGDILSCDLGQSDLARLSRTSKLLSSVAKPLLYRSVIIQSRRQLGQFVAEVREEDVAEVKRVQIVGEGNPWEIEAIVDVRSDFESLGDEQKGEKVAGCVKELIEGRFANSDKVESIFIRNIVENPSVLWMKGFKIVPSIFANLKDLSILSYRGGLNIVTDFLKHRYLPNLERLLLCDVTLTNPGEPLAIGQLPQLMETGPGGMPLFARGPPSEYGSLEGNLKGDLIDKLRFLISPSFDIFDKYPNLVHIAILTSRHFLRPSDRYAVVYISTRPTGRYEIVSIFAKLSEIATDFSNYSLEYLALPPSFEGRLHSFEGRLRDYETSILDNLEDLGVEIHYDGDLGGSIAPPSFTNYLTKKKEEEVSRNARMVD